MKDDSLHKIFTYSDNLGFNNPYYFNKVGRLEIQSKLGHVLAIFLFINLILLFIGGLTTQKREF